MSGDTPIRIDLARFRETFFQEAAEHLTEMEAGLLRMEEGSSDAETLNSIFRAAHSIKGASGTFGFNDVMRFTHALESLLDKVREGAVQPTPLLSDLLIRASDVLREALAAAASNAPPVPAMDALIEELYVAQRSERNAASQQVSLRSSDRVQKSKVYRILFRPHSEIFVQGIDPFLILRDVANLGESAPQPLFEVRVNFEGLPNLESLDPERSYLGWSARVRTNFALEGIRDVFSFVEDLAEIEIELESAQESTQVRTADAPHPVAARETSIRVSTAKVDKLIDLVGELVIAQSMAREISENFTLSRLSQLQESVSGMERYIRELQERVMSVRMLPIGHIFGRFPRLVRDVAMQLNKDVRLQISGEETELDKGVVEQLSDPLTHLVRNSIDHGIESPAGRRLSGKPEQGLIRLRAYHQTGCVVVEISDDGGGLNPGAIRRKAIERGLAGENDVLSEDQIHRLIFAPGFSTAQQVSDLSGRGVGMDVVRRNVEALNGSVSLTSQAGLGTTVSIKLPLTLAILDGLSLRVGAETYLLPLVAIVESVRPGREQISNVAGQGEVALLRGEPLPLIRLHRIFGIAGAVEDPWSGLIVIAEHGGERMALLIDELLGQQQVVIKSLEQNYRKVDGFLGATILGDGRAALILDVAGLLEIARQSRQPGRAA